VIFSHVVNWGSLILGSRNSLAIMCVALHPW